VASAEPTRVCTTVLDRAQHTATELVPDAPALSADERAAFTAAYAEEAAPAAVVVLIGSLPAGMPAGFYRDLLARTPGRAVLDARGDELLAALDARPFLVKPNRAELGRTFGRELRTDGELFDALRELVRRGATWAVVTDGPNPIYAGTRDRLYRIVPPPRAVVNPIGCGDCLAAGIAWALDHGRDPLDAIRHGAAAAAAKLGQLLPGQLDPAEAADILRSVEVRPV
jgi:fructose-1-phosphate kinase PfkB-like protein